MDNGWMDGWNWIWYSSCSQPGPPVQSNLHQSHWGNQDDCRTDNKTIDEQIFTACHSLVFLLYGCLLLIQVCCHSAYPLFLWLVVCLSNGLQGLFCLLLLSLLLQGNQSWIQGKQTTCPYQRGKIIRIAYGLTEIRKFPELFCPKSTDISIRLTRTVSTAGRCKTCKSITALIPL